MRHNTATGLLATICTWGLVAASPAQSASVTYSLDNSNRMADNNDYITVSVADGAAGALDFTVELLEPLMQRVGDRFGLTGFYLNLSDDLTESEVAAAIASIRESLPEGWRVQENKRLNGFGRFDLRLRATGPAARVNTLTFSIDGVEGDTLDDYLVPSRGWAPDGHTVFGARVASMKSVPAAANFGGAQAVVPLPAAAWLLVSAIGVIRLVARFKTS